MTLDFCLCINNQLVLFPQRIGEEIAEKRLVCITNPVIDSLNLENSKLMDVRGRWPVGDSIYAKMPTESYGNPLYHVLRARIKRENAKK